MLFITEANRWTRNSGRQATATARACFPRDGMYVSRSTQNAWLVGYLAAGRLLVLSSPGRHAPLQTCTVLLHTAGVAIAPIANVGSCSVGVLNCAKFRRNYSAPPDSFGSAELCEVARAKK